MSTTRRHFLKSCSAVAVGFLGLHDLFTDSLLAFAEADVTGERYGPPLADPAGFLDLPRGFSYRIISAEGDEMNDGYLVPGLPDAMAAFPGPDGLTILIRNHELTGNLPGPFGADNSRLKKSDLAKLYDSGVGKTPCPGGTTTIVLDTKTLAVKTQYLSLCGTLRNCAGGATPWNSWITCEESVRTADTSGKLGYFLEKNHGYNFEVPATATIELFEAIPLRAMGRFYHEAVAVDPRTGIVYQTEDLDDGLIYRFIPAVPGKLSEGGKLQALVIAGRRGADTRNWEESGDRVAVGEKLDVAWVDLDDVESPVDDLRHRGRAAGAACFARGEGMWAGDDGVYFVCTNGGAKRIGQIWRYVPSRLEGGRGEGDEPGTVELFIEPNNSALVEKADNLTVAPWGDLILCEDRSGEEVRLVGVTPTGRLYTFARHHRRCEFAGVTFSPDGSTLFVNVQDAGLTIAIVGPWT